MGKKTKLKKTKKLIKKKKEEEEIEKEEIQEISTDEEERMFINAPLHPPYQIILDTNFINDCIRKKIDLKQRLIETLDAGVDLHVTECVFAELEKLGRVYRLAVNMIRKLNVDVLKCLHKGNYADNCIIDRIKTYRCYFVATSDTCLRHRIKKLKTIPVIYFRGYKCGVDNFTSLL